MNPWITGVALLFYTGVMLYSMRHLFTGSED